MNEETQKYLAAKDVWAEIHRLFFGSSDDKVCDRSLQFFRMEKD